MKKILLSAIAIFLFVNCIKSQDEVKPVVIGLSFSPSIDYFSGVKPDDYKTDGSILGYSYGINIDFGFGGSSNYFLTTGIQLKRAGGKLLYRDSIGVNVGGLTNTELSRKYKINYLRIPIAFKLKTNQFDRFTFYGLFGLDNDIRLSAKANDVYYKQGSNGSDLTREDVDVKDNISIFRLGLLIGAGTEYTISGNTKAFAGIHFSNGFTDVLSEDNTLTSVKESAKQKYVELTLGILF